MGDCRTQQLLLELAPQFGGRSVMYPAWVSESAWFRRVAIAIAFVVAPMPAVHSAVAADAPPVWQLFSGSDLTQRSAFAHQGMIWAPAGHLHESGWRLRGLVSGGAYRYETAGFDIVGQSISAQVMAGFAWLRGTYGISVFAGPRIEDTRTRPHDPGKPRQGTRSGASVLAEAWLRLDEAMVLDAAVGGATANRTYSVRMAAGIDLSPRLFLSPEFALFGEPGYRQVRMGLFIGLRRSPSMLIKLGGGWASDRDGGGPYAGLPFKRWR
jgi:hypothetical protein